MFRLDEDFQRNQRISYFLTTVFTLQKGVKRFIYVARKEKKTLSNGHVCGKTIEVNSAI